MKGNEFYIVGIGASAGGHRALWEFFSHLPSNPGAAFVVVFHLKRDYTSMGRELMTGFTKMKVYRAEHLQLVKINCIYLMPENHTMVILNGRLHLKERPAAEMSNTAIDIFFHSLGHELKRKAIGIILSGMGSDGSKGVHTISLEGGMVMVQEPNSALFDSMPRMAIYRDDPEFILAPAQLAVALIDFINEHRYSLPSQ